MNKPILALDLGTKTGWCLRMPDGQRQYGLWILHDGKKIEGPGMRLLRLGNAIYTIMESHGHQPVIAYEIVRQRHNSSQAAHWYGAYLGHVQYLCESHGWNFTSEEVGAIKKYATGKGNAGKDAMLVAAQALLDADIADDNVADACWLAECVAHRESQG